MGKEAELYDAVMTAINRLLAGGTTLEEKQKELISLANKGKDFEFLSDAIEELREKLQTLLVEDASLGGENERINELIEFIRTNKYLTTLVATLNILIRILSI